MSETSNAPSPHGLTGSGARSLLVPLVALVAVAVLALLSLAGCSATASHPPYPPGYTPGPDAPQLKGWARVAPSPLSARHDALAIPLNGRYLVIGGTACPSNSRCTSSKVLRDAAAYDPSTDTWHTIAPTPLPITAVAPDQWAVLDNDLYLLVPHHGRPDLLRYESQHDRWSRAPSPPAPGVLAAGFTSLLWTAHHSNGRSPAVATLDPDAATWTAAPTDPLGPSSNRHIVNGDGDLVLIAETTDSTGTTQVQTTFIYSRTRGWRNPHRIPTQTSESFLTTSAFILPTRIHGRFGSPGVYSPGSGTFTPVTGPKPAPDPRLDLAADVVLNDGVLRDGLLLDTAARYSRLDAFPGRTREQATGASTGTTLFIWGGSHSPRQDLADGYLLYRPPLAPSPSPVIRPTGQDPQSPR